MKKKWPLVLGCVACLAIFVATFGEMIAEMAVRVKDEAVYEELVEIRNQTVVAPQVQSQEEAEDAPLEHQENAALLEVFALNDHMVGWVSIPGSVLDYPVMHTPNNPEYYLRRDFYGNYSISGTPFMDASCSLESSHWILYGHHMTNGTMFGSLLDYLDEDYRQSHSTVLFETMSELYTFEVVCGFYQHAGGELWTEGYFTYDTPEDFEMFKAYCQSEAVFGGQEELDYGDHLMSLVTCSGYDSDIRFVVVARRVEG